jgi:molecular chaperone GrpE
MTDTKTNGDAKPRTRAEERIAAAPVPTRSELLERIEALERELAEANARADDTRRNWQRSAADFANFRRRTDEERTTVAQLAASGVLLRLLAVLDDFDRALESVPPDAHEAWLEGIRLVERKLRAVLDSEGVRPIEAVGRPFDPNLHEAVAHVDTTDHPDNSVIDEIQRGYRLGERVLRPALVSVANNPNTQ